MLVVSRRIGESLRIEGVGKLVVSDICDGTVVFDLLPTESAGVSPLSQPASSDEASAHVRTSLIAHD